VISAQERVLFSNRAFSQILGLESIVVEGRPLVEVVRQSDLLAVIKRALANHEEISSEIVVGTVRPRSFAVTASPVRAEGPTGAVLVLHEISELRRLERVRQDFVANISHEFRTPLTAIQGFAETLLGGALNDTANRRRFVEIIRNHATRLARLTEDLLKLSRIEAGQLELEFQPVSVEYLVESCLETARLKAAQRDLIVEVSIPDGLPSIRGDANRLQEVLQNLLDNAVQYTPENGRIEMQASQVGDAVVLTVADTGIGIPQAEQELAKLSKQMESQGGLRMLKEEVDEEDVASIVSKWTGIPVSKMLEGEVKKLVTMEDRLRQRVIGQDIALERVANAIRRSRAGLSDPKRPIGSFIFLGPTGVGKTELARALAEFLFDDEHALLRIDMSEYMEKHSVARLIGAPPGYVGYEEGGQLTEQVRRRPYAVVLFDEIEKAHPDVFNVLLQIMDDGRLTDGKGRVVDFKNTIIIMTSNIGSAYLQAENIRTPEDFEKASEQVQELLHTHFKPEFLNRVDDIIVFRPLGKEQLVRIIELRLEDVRSLLADRKISLELTDAAKDLLFTQGYDPNFGARPLKRAIQKLIQDPLALKILDGEILHGDHVIVDADKKAGKMKFEVSRRVGEKEPAKAKR